MLTRSLLCALLAVPLSAVPLSPAFSAATSCTYLHNDFNGDGHADAVALSLRDPLGVTVHVVNGSGAGLVASQNQVFDIESSGKSDNDFHNFPAMTTGNFNGDCYADLAVGDLDSNSVTILYGGPSGLSITGRTEILLAQVFAGAGPDAGFGEAIASGDYNGDGIDDLAIGAPSATAGGGVAVVFGSAAGVTTAHSEQFTQASPGVPGAAANGDWGSTLAAGDFNGDSHDDLAIGSPEQKVGTSAAEARAVTVMPGSASGLTATGSTFWTQNTEGVPGTSESFDRFGSSLAAGDITGDGRDDLVIGTPDEGVGSKSRAGSITVMHGSSHGITATSSQVVTETTAGTSGTHLDEEFGTTLAIGDFNHDGHGDVAVGVPLGNTSYAAGHSNEGLVDVLSGTSTGVSTSHVQHWSQDSPGVIGTAENNDWFGSSLSALDVDGTGIPALEIGVPNEYTSGLISNGAFQLLYGGSAGLSATENQFIDGNNLADGAKSNDSLGRVVG